ncbi:peptidase M20 [Pseudoxanthomonas dokdonensis]|uniref:Peptidase M20 n=1 Tax=Pseudoxanthomonas dokdonensis TaxID=344882 RepID=A0A0R0CTQ0_9GAMM|nr:peptidase M20 [Pseudoxanthomonas dokdonensis]
MAAIALSATAMSAAAAQPGGSADVDISADNLTRHVRMLASDAFQGRAPATAGEDRTIAYISQAFAAAGLQPAGDHGGWTQAVPLVRASIDGDVEVSVSSHGQRQSLVNGDDIVVQTLKPVDEVDIRDAPLVFVGYGVHAPERQWDDYKGVDLSGKIALVLINDPDFETAQPGAFEGRGMTYYGRWTYKYEELARQGALGAIIVHETAPAAYGWATVRSSGLSPRFDIVRSDAERYHSTVRGWIQRDLAVSLFKQAGLDFEKQKQRAQQAGFSPVALPETSLSTRFKVKREQVVTHNVIGKLTGSQRPDESVIYSAHWDAYGEGEADAQGDHIRHGAVDNATGVAAVLELARVSAAAPRPARTQVFMALTAEEMGLLGAEYYVAHPLLPLQKTAAVINVEMLSPDGPTRDIASWGKGHVSLEQDLQRVARAHGRTYSPDPNLEAGFFYRADHFAFARGGVPAITIGAGLDRIDGGVQAGRALREAYFANCYHQPCDNWSGQWDASGQVRDVALMYALGHGIANSREWPAWLPASEFAATRAASDASRD